MSLRVLVDAFEHHGWATSRLIDTCLGLGPEQLETTVPGTYGSILDTMRHLVDGDATYPVWLTGDRTHAMRTDEMDPGELRDAIGRDGVAWSAFLARDADPGQIVKDVDEAGWERDAPVGIRLAQALHHGTDHRSQICTALTALGIEPPAIDVWAFGVDTGRVADTPPP